MLAAAATCRHLGILLQIKGPQHHAFFVYKHALIVGTDHQIRGTLPYRDAQGLGEFPTQHDGLDIGMMGQTCTHTWEVELPRGRLRSNAQQIQHFLTREHREPRDIYRPHAEILGFEHQGIDEGDTPRQPYTASTAKESFPQKPCPGKQTLAAQTSALRD